MGIVLTGFMYGLLCVLSAKGAVRDTYSPKIWQAKPDTQRVDALYKKSNKLADEGKIDQATIYLHQAKKLADSLHYKAGLENAYYTRGNILLVQRKADSAQVVVQKGIRAFPNGEHTAQLYNLLGTSYDMKGKIAKSLEAYQHAITLIDSTQNPDRLAHVKLNVAGSYYSLGQKGKAFKYYQQTISIAEQTKDSTFLAVVLNNIGNSYNQEKDFGKAEYYLKRAIDVSKAVNYQINELRATTNMGNTQKERGHLNKALEYYHHAMTLTKKLRPNSPPAILLYNMGIVYLEKGNYEKANENLKQSLAYSRQGHIGPGLFHNSMGLSRVAEKKGDTSKAIDWAEQALDAAQKSKATSFLSDANQRLYELHKKRGDYHRALGYLESLKTLSDSLHKREYKQQLAENETKLEMGRQNRINKLLRQRDQKQRAVLATQRWLIVAAIIIILLLGVMAFLQYRATKKRQQTMRLLREKKEEFEDLNNVKNKIFSILAHDLRNPLSALQGMLYLLQDHSLSNIEMREMSGQLELSIRQNVSIMENLLVWSRQQLAGIHVNPAKINIKNRVADIFEDHSFQAKQKQISLINDIPGDLQMETDPDLLKLILRNLINNGIKFSNIGDKITVTCCRKGNFATFKVMDNGIGIPAQQQKELLKASLKSRRGTGNEKGMGLGLNLCKEFVDMQGGRLSFESTEGKGTTFIFTLPASS